MASCTERDDDAVIAKLRPLLKVPRSSDLPSPGHVRLALQLARDPSIDPSMGNFWPKDITSSATRTRIKKLAMRMLGGDNWLPPAMINDHCQR